MTDGPPAFAVPTDVAEWARRRRRVRRTLWRLLGDLPARPARPRARIVRRDVARDHVREELVLDGGRGEGIPATLVLPRDAPPPHPALCWLHAHGSRYDVGRQELFARAPVRETPAVALARRGYAVLAIDARGFGSRQGRGPGGPAERGRDEETSLAKAFLWQGTCLWGMMVRDDLVALDYLARRPDVDPRRLGATGMSMGSTRAWWLAALDDRIAAVVAVACLTRYQELLRTRALRRHGIYYFVPGFLRHFDTEAVVGLVAPRPLLTLTGDRDAGSPVRGVRAINDFCARVYALYGRRAEFRGTVLRGVGHAYTPDMWRRMVSWFDAHL